VCHLISSADALSGGHGVRSEPCYSVSRKVVIIKQSNSDFAFMSQGCDLPVGSIGLVCGTHCQGLEPPAHGAADCSTGLERP
jgi:hypothetical protein